MGRVDADGGLRLGAVVQKVASDRCCTGEPYLVPGRVGDVDGTRLAQAGPVLSSYSARRTGEHLWWSPQSYVGGHWRQTSYAVPAPVAQVGVSEPGFPLLGGRGGAVTSRGTTGAPVNGHVPAGVTAMQVGEWMTPDTSLPHGSKQPSGAGGATSGTGCDVLPVYRDLQQL